MPILSEEYESHLDQEESQGTKSLIVHSILNVSVITIVPVMTKENDCDSDPSSYIVSSMSNTSLHSKL